VCVCVCVCVCVEKEISYFRFSPDFIPKQGGSNVLFFSFSLTTSLFQVAVSCPSHLA